jgi:glutamate--cysteine ligase catalytic subunit
MGFLTVGNTFSWEEASEKPTELVRKNGISQFLAIYNKLKDRKRDSLRWGDEVIYRLVA